MVFLLRGFARYSTDDRWHVPHFEKMLYDQAQLAVAYSQAYRLDWTKSVLSRNLRFEKWIFFFRATKDQTFATVVEHIVECVMRDLR